MSELLAAFICSYLGSAGVGTNAANRGQCVGLVEQWLARFGYPAIAGNAKDLLANADRKVYSVQPNGPSNFPSCGAIAVWDASWGGGYGHCAVVVAANSMHLAVFEQNDPTGAPAVVATHGYAGVAGWVELPASAGTSKTGGA